MLASAYCSSIMFSLIGSHDSIQSLYLNEFESDSEDGDYVPSDYDVDEAGEATPMTIVRAYEWECFDPNNEEIQFHCPHDVTAGHSLTAVKREKIYDDEDNGLVSSPEDDDSSDEPPPEKRGRVEYTEDEERRIEEWRKQSDSKMDLCVKFHDLIATKKLPREVKVEYMDIEANRSTKAYKYRAAMREFINRMMQQGNVSSRATAEPDTLGGVPPHEKDLFADDVDEEDSARGELSVQISRLRRADILVDKLIAQAKMQQADDRRDRAIEKLIKTQEAAFDARYAAIRLYKFRKTADGSDAGANSYRASAADVGRHIESLIADAKLVYACKPSLPLKERR